MNTPTPTLCQSLREMSGVYRAFNDTMASQLDEAAERLERLEVNNAELENTLEDAKDALLGLLEEVEQCVDCAPSRWSQLRIRHAKRILQ